MVQTNGTAADSSALFGLDQDLKGIETALLQRGEELGPAIKQLKGIRLMRCSSIIECLFCFLCSANNSLHRIVPMCWKLGEFGKPLRKDLHAFPTLEKLQEIEESQLRNLGFGYRAATIPKSAKFVQMQGGEGWLLSLRNDDYYSVHSSLMTIPGVGPKLADCVALYGYGFQEAVPLDTHVWQAFTRLYYPEWSGKSVTKVRYQEATQRFRGRFGDLSGWAQLFLYYGNLTSKRIG